MTDEEQCGYLFPYTDPTRCCALDATHDGAHYSPALEERRCLRGDEEPQPLCHRHGMSPFIDDLGQCRAAREAERE